MQKVHLAVDSKATPCYTSFHGLAIATLPEGETLQGQAIAKFCL